MKKTSVKSKTLAFGLCAAVVGAACIAPICYLGGGAHLTDPNYNLSTADTETVEFNKLGKDLAQPVFADLKTRQEQKFNAFQSMMVENGNFDESGSLNEASIMLAHQEIASWVVDDVVMPLNDDEAISGEGTESSPYIIKNAKGWKWFVLKTGSPTENRIYTYAELGADIDFGGELYYMDAILMEDGSAIGLNGFSGVLDGKGHSISNVVICGSGLFTNVGNFLLNFSTGDMGYYDFQPTQIKNLNFNENIYSLYLGGDAPVGTIAGVSSDVVFENVNFGLEGYGSLASMICYGMDGTTFVNCDFKLSGYNSTICVVQGAAPIYMFGIEGASGLPISFENCTSTIEHVGDGCNYVGMSMYGTVNFYNSTSKGYIISEGTNGKVGSFVVGGGDASDSTYSFINCVNYTVMATGGDQLGGIITKVDDDVSLTAINCVNYGDLYYIGGRSYIFSNNIVISRLGGILGVVEDTPSVEISGCINYANLYSAGAQAGILNLSVGTEAIITGCANYGNLMYCLETSGGILNAFWAGDDSSTANIVNCKNAGDFINYSLEDSEKLGYIYKDPNTTRTRGHAYMNIAAGIASGYWSGANISISNCHNVSNFKNFSEAAGITSAWGAMHIENCTSFISAEGGNESVAESSLSNNSANESYIYGISSGQPKVLRNCYSEIRVKYREDVEDKGLIYPMAFSAALDAEIDNVQSYCEIDLTPFPVTNTSYSIGMGLATLWQFGGCPELTGNFTNMQNVSFTVKNILADGVDLDLGFDSDYDSPELRTWEVDNVKIDIDIMSGANTKSIVKWLIDKDELNFDASEWFYSENLNGGIPMLRKLFWQGSTYVVPLQDDILDKFEELGFTKFVAA